MIRYILYQFRHSIVCVNKMKFLDLHANYQSMKDEIDNAIHATIDSTQFIDGVAKKQFEREFAEYIGVKHCIGVANGTDALEIGISAFDFPAGSEILTQPNSFIATALGITHNNLKPVFVDIDKDTLMIDCAQIEEHITPRTKALCIVHLYGCSPDMDEIMRIVNKHNLVLIEDCAQSHGALYNGKRVGTFGHVSCFSFYPGKNLGCFGDGGAICTNNNAIHDKIRLIHNMGSSQKYYHDIIGRNSRLDTLQAAVLSVKLKHLDANNEKRRHIAARYTDRLRTLNKHVVTPNVHPESNPVWHLYVVRILNERRTELQAFLKSKNIDTIIHYPIPIHKQRAYSPMYEHTSYPVCEEYADEILSLPMYPELTMAEVDYVCDTITQFYETHL